MKMLFGIDNAAIFHRDSLLYVATIVGQSTFPLNSYHIFFITDFDKLSKENSKQLIWFGTASEFETKYWH